MRVVYESKLAQLLPKGTIAFTWGDTVYVAGARITQGELLHEAAHVEQFRRLGKLRFVMRYFWYSLTIGYRGNPLEIEARVFANRRVTQCSFLENADYLDSLSRSPSSGGA